MNEKFNKNAKVEQLSKMCLSLGENKGLIVKDPFTILAIEWMGPPYGTRLVSIRMSTERRCLRVLDRDTKILRVIDIKQDQKVRIRTSSDKPMNLLSILFPGEIDLVSYFEEHLY